MTYTKPEIEVVGDAARVIQGGKHNSTDGASLLDNGPIADCELDD